MTIRSHRARWAILALLLLPAAASLARPVTDAAGRAVEVPDHPGRVVAAGPPAAVLLYALAPQAMIGWVQAPAEAALPYLLPAVRALPALGRLTGRAATLSPDRLAALRPDLIVDFGTIAGPYRSLAERVQAETAIPYLLIDGRLSRTPAALRLVGGLLGVAARGEALARAAEEILDAVDRAAAAAARRPRLYVASGPQGLETRAPGTLNTEIYERAHAINVADGASAANGLVRATLAQIIAWAPDTIIALDRATANAIAGDPAWRAVPAAAADRVFVAPGLPFGFVDDPPSLNRLLGLVWLKHLLYPGPDSDPAQAALEGEIRRFYRLFYLVDLDAAAMARLRQGTGE